MNTPLPDSAPALSTEAARKLFALVAEAHYDLKSLSHRAGMAQRMRELAYGILDQVGWPPLACDEEDILTLIKEHPCDPHPMP